MPRCLKCHQAGDRTRKVISTWLAVSPDRRSYLIDSVPGDHVAEADGAEGDEAEVEPVEEAPALPLPEDDRPAANVADHHRQAQRDRHSHLHI